MQKWFIIILLLLVSCKKENPSEINGYIEGEYVYIAPSFGGILDEINVKKGQEIKIGDKLFSVDKKIWLTELTKAQNEVSKAHANFSNLSKGKRKEELQIILSQKQQAIAVLENAKKEYYRYKELALTNTSSKAEYDKRLSDYESAKAKVQELQASFESAELAAREDELKMAMADIEIAEQNLLKLQNQIENVFVTSKVNGIVETLFSRAGEYVPAGNPVISVLPPDNVKIRFYVSEQMFSGLKMNLPLTVFCDGCNEKEETRECRSLEAMSFLYDCKKGRSAKISFISSRAEFTPPVIYSVESRKKLVFMIEAVFDDKSQNLPPGLPVSIRIKHE